MNALIANLKLWEVVMLGLGSLLFIVSLILLARKPQASLAIFFILAIIMIGFPAIQSIKFSKDVVEIVTRTDAVEKNPSDTTAVKELEIKLKNIDSDRLSGNPQALNDIANAHSALGNYDKALKIIDQAAFQNPGDKQILASKVQIETKLNEKVDFEKKITELNQIVGSHTEPEPAKAQRVAEILTTMKAPVFVDKQSSITLARAFTIVNEKEKAQETLNKITEVHPDNPSAVEIQNQLQKDTTAHSASGITPELRTRLRNSSIIYAATRQKLVIKN